MTKTNLIHEFIQVNEKLKRVSDTHDNQSRT